jgi:hypothetical protein
VEDPTPSRPDPGRPTKLDGLNGLAESDPSFSASRFVNRVTEMFVTVARAVSDKDVSRVRDFTDDRAYTYLQSRLDYGVQFHEEELRVDRVDPLVVSVSGAVQQVSVRIHASAVPIGAPGNRGLRRAIQEYWTLVRQRPADPMPSSVSTKCPQCGAPIRAGNAVDCAYCGVRLAHADDSSEGQWFILSIERESVT